MRGIVHQPTRPVDKDKTEVELALHVKKAVSAEETAPKQKHVRSASIRLINRFAITAGFRTPYSVDG